MEDRTAGTAILNRFIEAINQGNRTWHARPDTDLPSQFVFDDGTGDIELQFTVLDDHIEPVLLHRGSPVASLRLSVEESSEQTVRELQQWLAGLLEQLRSSDPSSKRGQGRSRVMVTLETRQLDRLRELAERQGVPVTELVRSAVDRYLAMT